MTQNNPAPARAANEGAQNSARPTGPPRPNRKKSRIPEVEEILGQMIQLNGAVLTGTISAKDASFLQRNLKAVLDVQLKRTSNSDTGPRQEALVDLCRRDPRAISEVAPFLTDEQLQTLMAEIADEPDESV